MPSTTISHNILLEIASGLELRYGQRQNPPPTDRSSCARQMALSAIILQVDP